jgi:hydroxymethylglutaryl-CoA synthase
MEITPPMYKRSMGSERLLGTICSTCNDVLYGIVDICPKCGRVGTLETIKLIWNGKVFSSSTIHAAQLGFEDKIPYTTGIVEIDGVRVPALFDSEKRMNVGEKVEARIGKIKITSDGLVIYRPVWEKSIEYSKPNVNVNNSLRKSTKLREVGIEGYGVYVPRYRISGEEISRVWGKGTVKSVKSFSGKWDDTGSYAMNATLSALRHAGISGEEIEEIMVGSESHPHAVYPTASKVAGFIDSTGGAMDTEFACKAATAGMKSMMALAESAYIQYGLVIGADSGQSSPNDALEYNVGDAGAAFIFGEKKPIARLEGRPISYTTDTPDFWRNTTEVFPRHAERFSLDPGYYSHTIQAAEKLLKELSLCSEDFDYVTFHQPNRRLPREVGKRLGFKKEQIEPGIVVDYVGNVYSAASPLGLAKILDEASPGQRILMVSYGSGAGSDAFSFITTENIDQKRNTIKRSVRSWIGEEDKEHLMYCDYSTYARYKGLYKNQ